MNPFSETRPGWRKAEPVPYPTPYVARRLLADGNVLLTCNACSWTDTRTDVEATHVAHAHLVGHDQ